MKRNKRFTSLCEQDNVVHKDITLNRVSTDNLLLPYDSPIVSLTSKYTPKRDVQVPNVVIYGHRFVFHITSGSTSFNTPLRPDTYYVSLTDG